jgi:hypothetical protein
VGRDSIVRRALRDRFVFTVRSGETFDGLLIEVDAKTYRLADVFAVGEKGRVKVDGELFLPRSEVVYLQRPGGVA